MTPVRWGVPAWVSGAAALALLVVGVLLVRPPRAQVVLTEPDPTALCGVVAGATVPDAPLSSRHVRPAKNGLCEEDGAVVLGGACWMPLERRPRGENGCGTAGWEHAGKCWTPVWQSPRPPQSATP